MALLIAMELIEINDIGGQVADILHHDLEYDNLLMSSIKGRAGQRIAKQTAEGRQLTISMAEAGHFPDSIIQLTRIGEETGDLGIMFEKSADYLTTEIQSKLESTISILEPLIIIVLGGIVALVVIALMTTTMSLNLMVT